MATELMDSELMNSELSGSGGCCLSRGFRKSLGSWGPFLAGSLAALGLCAAMAVAFWCGRATSNPSEWTKLSAIPSDRIHPELRGIEQLRASATHGGPTMAVCTAQVDEDAEGFFTLDYLTGDLKGWVYYPRMAAFGGLFATNVIQYLGPPGKNPEYLLISGGALPAPSGSNVRAASSLLYVVDVKLGSFVAFTIPWNRSMENSGVQQMNTFVPVGGDVIRPMMGPGNRKPPAVNPNANNKAGNANPNPNDPNNGDPDNPDPNAPNPNQPPKNNQPNNNNNNRKPAK